MPVVPWKIVGDKAVVQGHKGIADSNREITGTIKETAAESQRYDRLATQIANRQTSNQEKYEKSVRDVVQVMNTNRKVTREMAEKELERLRHQYDAAGDAAATMGYKQAESARKATAIIRGLETAQQRYSRELGETVALHQQGLLTDEQAIAQSKKLRTAILGVADAADREAREQRELAAAHALAAREAKKHGDLQEAARQRMVSRGYANQSRDLAEQNRMQREAAAALRATATAQELHNQRVLQYGKWLRATAIDKKQFVALVRQSKEELAAAGRAQDGAFGTGAIAQLRNYVLGVGGVMTAVQLARSEYEAWTQSIDRRAGSQIDVAAAMKGLSFAAIALPKSQGDALPGIASSISADTGLPLTEAAQGLRGMLAVNPDVARAEEYLRYGGKAFAGLPDADKTLTSILQVGNSLGKKTPAQEAFGYFGTVATYSNVVNEEQLSRNLVRTMQGYKSYGVSPNVGAAVLNAYSNALADPYGEVSRTAALNLPVAVDKMFADKANRKLIAGLGMSPEDYDTTEERLQLVLNNAQGLGAAFNRSSAGQEFGSAIAQQAGGSELAGAKAFQEAVIKAGSSRGASIGGVRGTLLGLSETAQDAMRNTLAALGDREGVMQTGADVRDRLENAVGEDTADFNRTVAAAEQRSNVAAGNPALTAEAKAAFDQTVRNFRSSAGLSTFFNSFSRYAQIGAEITPQEGADYLQSQLDQASSPNVNPAVPGNPALTRGADFEAQRGEMLTLLRQLRDAADRQAAAAENGNRNAPSTSRQE